MGERASRSNSRTMRWSFARPMLLALPMKGQRCARRCDIRWVRRLCASWYSPSIGL